MRLRFSYDSVLLIAAGCRLVPRPLNATALVHDVRDMVADFVARVPRFAALEQ